MAPVPVESQLTLTILNRTDEDLIAYSSLFDAEKEYCLHQAPRSRQHVKRDILALQKDDTGIDIQWLGENNNNQVLHLPALFLQGREAEINAKWKTAQHTEVGSSSSYRVLYRILPSSVVQTIILPERDPARFLSCVSDEACLTSLCIPGTHESLALYGWPISTCQNVDSSIEKQLNDGIRYFDIRLAPKGQVGKERLLAYHGITDQRIEFGKVLQECFDFLDGVGRNETIIMSLKQEQGVQDTFIRLLFTHYVDQSPASRDGRLQGGRQRWFLEDRIPKLGEVRGKIVMLSRFVIAKDYGFPGGISPPIWPNSLKGLFSYNLRSSHQLVQTQDWYDIGSLSALPEKMSLIEQLCDESGSDADVFSLNYCNGSSFPFALPPAVAKGFLENGTLERREKSVVLRLLSTEGVNSQLRNYVVGRLFDSPSANKVGLGAIDGFKVTWALDYYNEPKGAADLVTLLIEANF